MVRLPPAARPLYPLLKPVYTRATRLVAPFTVGLSRLSGSWLPAGSVATTEQAAEATGGRWAMARAEEVIRRHRVPPGPHASVFEAAMEETCPRAVVAELPGGRVLGPHHAVVTGGPGLLVQDLSYYFGTTVASEHPLYWHPRIAPPLHVAGRLGVLATRGDVNYYHFLMDVLPRLAVLAACPEIEPPERWYVSAGSRFQRELLDRVGITEDVRVDASTVAHVRADTLVVPSPPSMTVINPPWVVQWLRRTLLDAAVDVVPGSGIYITRGTAGNNRAVVNEAAVVVALRDVGFDVVDPGVMSVADQIRTFAQAEIIVATHGAALANLVFAGPGSTVIELFPAGNLVPDYWKLADGVVGLDYRYLLGLGNPPATGRATMLVQDIEVDLPALLQIVEDCRSASGSKASEQRAGR